MPCIIRRAVTKGRLHWRSWADKYGTGRRRQTRDGARPPFFSIGGACGISVPCAFLIHSFLFAALPDAVRLLDAVWGYRRGAGERAEKGRRFSVAGQKVSQSGCSVRSGVTLRFVRSSVYGAASCAAALSLRRFTVVVASGRRAGGTLSGRNGDAAHREGFVVDVTRFARFAP